jgi:hypothetical protein
METLKLHPQYVNDNEGLPIGVFLTVSEFESIIEDLEDLEDIKAADAFTSRPDKEFIPFRQALEEIKNGLVK